MKRLAFLLVLTACASHPAPAPATPAAPKGPVVTHPIEPGRLDDATGNRMLETDEQPIKVDGNVVSVFVCRPDGQDPAFVADDQHHAYITFSKTDLVMPPPDANGRATMKEPQYCSVQRFVMPDGLTYAGELKQ